MNGQLLIDTCAVLWLSGLVKSRSPGHVEAALEAALAAGEAVLVSPISGWEIGMLVAKGRLSLTLPVKTWIAELMRRSRLEWADMPDDVLIASHSLPEPLHGDPADRIIIATAREYGMRIVTRDRKILDYADRGHVLALAC